MTAAVQTVNLTRDYATVRALDQLTMTIEQGSIFGLLGPNGAGKTTTLHLLLGLSEPTSGYVRVMNFDPGTQGEQVRSISGALLEHHGLYERLSAEKNLEFIGRVYHMPKPERQTRIRDLLTSFELWERRHEPIKSWSRGMKQRLAIVRAIFHRPQIVFLDEPTAGLDPLFAHDLRKIIQSLASDLGITVILNTHNLAEAEQLCTHIGVINQGKLLDSGRTEHLLSNMGHHELVITGNGFTSELVQRLEQDVRVKSAHFDTDRLALKLMQQLPANDFLSLVIQTGGEIAEVRRPQSSLEDLFIKLIQADKVAQ